MCSTPLSVSGSFFIRALSPGVIVGLGLIGAAGEALAQPQVGPVQMPPVSVTAQKEPAEAQRLPVSVTAVSGDVLTSAGISFVSEAAIYAPNTNFTELTARKISNATFRGIGSSPANAGITTVIDGVPQLNTNSSSVTLLEVEQIEFVRGPQSTLYGRNTLGGLVNITTRRPSLDNWSGSLSVPFTSYTGVGVRGQASGPIREGTLGLGVSFDYENRDGFTTNTVTGNDLDARSAFSAKAQLLWTPSDPWEARLIVAGERARDGDYALTDLAALRANPYDAARDFEGETDRDILSTTFLTRRTGSRYVFSTSTGIVAWDTRDLTDLDYSPVPLARRDNREDDLQFTHESRFATVPTAPVRASFLGDVSMQWQAGFFAFAQAYEQDAINSYAPSLLSPFIPIQLDQHIPQASLDDVGAGGFALATFTNGTRWDAAVGARYDHEWKDATIRTFFTPELPQAGLPATLVDATQDFGNISPQASFAFRVQPDRTIYAAVSQGYKAGGFNPTSPQGSEAYGEEQAWHTEFGWKSSWAGGRVVANAAAFFIDWDDIQLNLPDPNAIGQFYIANVGRATSRGIEVEMAARPHPQVSLFGAYGYTRARFKEGSLSGGRDVGGNRLPNTPRQTFTVGLEAARPISQQYAIVARVETVYLGPFEYDNANTAREDGYAITNLRASLRRDRYVIDAWVRNLFDTFYVPVAFEYPAFAPSGFIGEPGRPRTFGVTLGVGF